MKFSISFRLFLISVGSIFTFPISTTFSLGISYPLSVVSPKLIETSRILSGAREELDCGIDVASSGFYKRKKYVEKRTKFLI